MNQNERWEAHSSTVSSEVQLSLLDCAVTKIAEIGSLSFSQSSKTTVPTDVGVAIRKNQLLIADFLYVQHPSYKALLTTMACPPDNDTSQFFTAPMIDVMTATVGCSTSAWNQLIDHFLTIVKYHES